MTDAAETKLTSLRSTLPLADGQAIPRLGLGTWKAAEGEEAEGAVRHALEVGYRHIDTAAVYGNEESVGRALKAFDKPEEVYVTTKLWNDAHGSEAALKAFDESRRRLGVDVIDLYLIHWPCGLDFLEAWRALEKLAESGKVRSIGLSNFLVPHLEKLLPEAERKPVIDQVETHPWLTQPALHRYLADNGIATEAWSPLMQGRFSDVKELQEIGEAHGKSPAQVLIRWSLQKGYVVIPKSTKEKHIESNARVFDFELSDAQMKSIDALDRGQRLGPDPMSFG